DKSRSIRHSSWPGLHSASFVAPVSLSYQCHRSGLIQWTRPKYSPEKSIGNPTTRPSGIYGRARIVNLHIPHVLLHAKGRCSWQVECDDARVPVQQDFLDVAWRSTSDRLHMAHGPRSSGCGLPV